MVSGVVMQEYDTVEDVRVWCSITHCLLEYYYQERAQVRTLTILHFGMLQVGLLKPSRFLFLCIM